MSEVIIAYQFSGSLTLYTEDYHNLILESECRIKLGIGASLDQFKRVVAKWIIKPKGGMPKLDTPILSEEDVKDLDNDR